MYGLNTLGAVFGVLLSGFLTIGWLGERRTIYLGVLINLVVAFTAWLIYRVDVRAISSLGAVPARREAATAKSISPYPYGVRMVVLIVFAISGFTALAYEIIWTRQLILFLGTSIYAFSGMLAVFLCGIALGSVAMSAKLDRLIRPVGFFALLELAVGLLSVASLYLYYPLDSRFAWGLLGLFLPILVTVLFVFPIAFLFGMIFPIAALCYAKDTGKTGASVGLLYSANTVGSILGSLLTGFLLVPRLGSTNTMMLLACTNVGLGLVLLSLESGKSMVRKLAYIPIVLLFAVAAVGAYGKDPFLATIERRALAGHAFTQPAGDATSRKGEIYYNKEGIEGTVTAFSRRGDKMLWINGIGMTLLCTETKLMTHLPLMYARNPKEFLVICFGMGTSFRSAMLYPNLNVTAVELVPEVYETFKYYHPDAEELKKKPNVRLLVNDGRNTLLLTNKKYDVISVDPAPPIWSAGTVNLYSLEFFRLCKSRLTPDGVMCLWFPGGRDEDNLAIMRTFSEVFENTTVWIGPHQWGFYLIGTMRDISRYEFDVNMQRAFEQPTIRGDLVEYDTICATPKQLEDLRWLDRDSVRFFADKGVVITDNDPYTEFFLWRLLRRTRLWKAWFKPQS